MRFLLISILFFRLFPLRSFLARSEVDREIVRLIGTATFMLACSLVSLNRLNVADKGNPQFRGSLRKVKPFEC